MNGKNLISPPDADVPHVRAPVHPRAGLRRQMWGQDRLQASQVKVAAHQTASPQAARILPVQVLHDATRTKAKPYHIKNPKVKIHFELKKLNQTFSNTILTSTSSNF